MEEINYILYGSSLAALFVVLLILFSFKRQLSLWIMVNFSDKAVKTTVLEVIEGDTIRVKIPTQTNKNIEKLDSVSRNQNNEISWTVRLIGVDTPESRPSLYIDEAPFGKEALAYTTKRLEKNKSIILVFDQQIFDKFDKHLAYVYFYSGECLNETILKEGYGWIRKHSFDIKLEKQLEKAQQKAKNKQKGIWNMYVTKGILREEYKNTDHYQEYRKRIEEKE